MRFVGAAVVALLVSAAAVLLGVSADQPAAPVGPARAVMRPVSPAAPDSGAARMPPAQRAGPAVDLVERARHAVAVTIDPRPPRPKPPPVRRLDFVIGTFNALGSSHTAGGGSHARYARGVTRAAWAAAIVTGNGADVVGFQELQAVQLASFMRATGGRFAAYPGFSLGGLNTQNSIVWRTDVWQPVQSATFMVPYFGGHPRLMPYVLLRNPGTGVQAWFVNVHNPADTGAHRHQQRFRDRAMSIEIALVNRLALSGYPVFFTGDMNERSLAFCRFTGEAAMSSASGGTNVGACLPRHPEDVDWIFGRGRVQFSGYQLERGPLIRRTTDHFVPFSQVEISQRPGP